MKKIIPSPLTTFLKFTVVGLVALSSCKDDPTLTGLNMVPEAEQFKPLSDSSTPISAMNTSERIQSDDASYGVIGLYDDPQFGTTQSDFMVQLLPDVFELDSIVRRTPLDSLIVDSLYLTMPIVEKSWLGNVEAKHMIDIYELVDGLNAPKYYSDMDMTGLTSPLPILSKELTANSGYYPTDTIDTDPTDAVKDSIIYKWNATSTWQLKMPNELTQRLFSFYTDDVLPKKRSEMDSRFKDVFKGLYLTSTPSDLSKTSLIPISLLSGNTFSLTLKFRKMKMGKTKDNRDTLMYTQYSKTMLPYYEGKRINRFLHVKTDNIVENDVNVANLYIQGMGGSFAAFKIDTAKLYSWKDSLFNTSPRYGISNIELKLEADTIVTDIRSYNPISQLYVWMKNDKGELTNKPYFKCGQKSGYVFEANTETTPYATFNWLKDQLNYHLRINPYYFEALMAYKKNPNNVEFTRSGGKYEGFLDKDDENKFKYIYELDEFWIKPISPDTELKRVILKSPAHDESPLKLKIKYFTFQ